MWNWSSNTEVFCNSVLLLDSYTFNFLKFLKYIYKNLLRCRGLCLLSSETEVTLFHCFSSSIVVCFSFSSVNMPFLICATLYTMFLPTSLYLLPSQLDPEIYCLQNDIRNCFEGSDALLSLVIRQFFCCSWVAYCLHTHNYLWRFAVVSERQHDATVI